MKIQRCVAVLIAVVFSLPASALQPDDYTLEVTIIDKLQKKESRRVVRQEIDFSIE